MDDKTNPKSDFATWAAALETGVAETKAAWHDLQRRGLVAVADEQITISPLAMRRASSPLQRRLAAHLSGYLLTENSFIVRQAGEPAGSPRILNTRIAVEYVANYFDEGWGVTEIERDLTILTREEIEAAIQYYLNHREEIEQERQRSRQIHEMNARRSATSRKVTRKIQRVKTPA